MKASIGRIVHYTLTADDAAQINRRRTSSEAILHRIKKNSDDATHWPLGAQAHIGNEVAWGQTLPMVIVAVHSDICVNGQVFLDGNDLFWVKSGMLNPAFEPVEGHWMWPNQIAG